MGFSLDRSRCRLRNWFTHFHWELGHNREQYSYGRWMTIELREFIWRMDASSSAWCMTRAWHFHSNKTQSNRSPDQKQRVWNCVLCGSPFSCDVEWCNGNPFFGSVSNKSYRSTVQSFFLLCSFPHNKHWPIFLTRVWSGLHSSWCEGSL